MRRLLKASGLVCAGLFVLALSGIAWLAFAPAQDPERFAARGLPEVVGQSLGVYDGEGCPAERLCRDVTVTLAREAPIRFTLSLPAGFDGRRLPVLVVFGGIREGREELKRVPPIGATAVITYEYPVDVDRLEESWLPERLALGHAAALATPRQLAALTRWLGDQDWADRERVSLVGVSFGALVLPAANRLAWANGESLGPSALIYGGVGLGELVAKRMDVDQQWLRRGLAWVLGLAGRPIEPASHLPHLRGETLVINGARDRKIPLPQARAMQALTPEPKRVVIIDSEHLDPDKDPETLEHVLEMARDWLAERGAVGR